MTDKNTLVASSEPVPVPTPHGTFAVSAYEFADGTEHMLATAVGADGRTCAGRARPPGSAPLRMRHGRPAGLLPL